MNRSFSRRAALWVAAAMVALAAFHCARGSAQGGTRHSDPAQVVPLHLIAPQFRDSVADVVASPSFQRQGTPDAFPCNAQIYLNLLNQPVLTLALWQDLSTTPARLRQVGPDRFEGTDGNGASAIWYFVHRSPRLHVLLCDLDYVGPRGNTHISGRIVVVVHTEYFRKGKAEEWVRHSVEMFVKIDSRGWRAIAKTARPILEKVLDDQIQEAGWFVSLMGRLVEMYPNWACKVAKSDPAIPADVRQAFTRAVLQNRRPGASAGRPSLAENVPSETQTR